ncbi:MAG: general secretion pathway protein GspB, partial [bacterium]
PVPTPQKQVVVSKPEPARNPETAPAKPVVKPTISLPVAQAPAVAAKPSITSANKEPAATVAKPEIASTLPPVDQMVETLPVEPETTTDQALDVEAYRQEMLQLVAEEEARDAAAKQKAEQEAAVKKSSPSKPQYPLRRDLPSNIRDQIPNLNVLVHVWSAKPQDRFVVLNSSRMTEGSRHNNGIKLIEIQRDGLLLEFSGERFIEPR